MTDDSTTVPHQPAASAEALADAPGDLPEDGYFPESVAATYDADCADRSAAPAVDFLAALAGDGPALEFAIGTGRIAVPLAERGVPLAGIELSRAMLARLRAKPAGADLPVTVGDMTTATAPNPGTYALAYLVFNTINNLTTQDAQVDVFRNAAAHLAPGGRFVVEVGVPGLRGVPHGQPAAFFGLTDTDLAFDRYEDIARQRFSSHYVTVTPDGRGTHRSIPFRYVWPSELDLMARLAGMRLESRYEDWDRRPFDSDSTRHVSVYRKETKEAKEAKGAKGA